MGTELRAYRCFLRAHARVTRCVESDLIGEQQLTLAAYEVLDCLAAQRENGLRMTDLADAVLLSRSGVTRLVARLERLGLVRRRRTSSDGRGVRAQITEHGEQRLHEASPTHLGAVMRYFAAALGDGDVSALDQCCERLSAEGVPPPPGQRAQA